MAGNIAGEGHLVGDDDHGQALLGQLAHNAQHFTHHLGVQGGGRLVKQQHFGLHGQRTGDGHALLLAAGKLAGLGVDVGGHAHLFQVAQCRLAGGLLVLVQHVAQAGGAVVQHGHVVEEVEALEHHAHLGAVGAGVRAFGRDVLPMEQHAAVGRGLQQVDAAQQRGFSAAGGADHAGNIAVVDGKVNIAQHHVGAKAFGEVAHLNDGFRHGMPLLSYPDSGTYGPGPGRCTCRWCRPGYRWCSGRSSGGRPGPSPRHAAGSWPAASSTGR